MATYTSVLTDEGSIVDDSVVFCTADDAFLYIIGTGNSGAVVEEIAKGKDVTLELNDALQLISMQGLKAVGHLDF